jgi:hypothetical protein
MTTTPGGETPGVFCCKLVHWDEEQQTGYVVDCIEYQEWEVVAASLCVSAALSNPEATGSELSEGPCSGLLDCPSDPNDKNGGGW